MSTAAGAKLGGQEGLDYGTEYIVYLLSAGVTPHGTCYLPARIFLRLVVVTTYRRPSPRRKSLSHSLLLCTIGSATATRLHLRPI